jgi:hypothetical protein
MAKPVDWSSRVIIARAVIQIGKRLQTLAESGERGDAIDDATWRQTWKTLVDLVGRIVERRRSSLTVGAKRG